MADETGESSQQQVGSLGDDSTFRTSNSELNRFGGSSNVGFAGSFSSVVVNGTGSLANGSAQNSSNAGKVKGKNYSKNFRRKQNLKGGAGSGNSGIPRIEVASAVESLRFQLRMVTGEFTEPLKCELIRILNTHLYSIPPGSFIPSFLGYGLRFGLVWFSPSNQESSIWLRQILEKVSEAGTDSCKFTIEPFGLHQNKISILIPWDEKEGLTVEMVSARLLMLNPGLSISKWKFLSMKKCDNHRLVIWGIGDDSFTDLHKRKFHLSYGFERLLVKVAEQK